MSGRIRTFKPEWNDDEKLIYCSPAARTLSVSLVLLADDYGNGRFVGPALAGRLFPAYPELFEPAIEELMAISYLTLYRVNGQTYFNVRTFPKHQRVDNAGKPRVPPHTDPLAEILREIPRVSATTPGARGWIPTPTPTPNVGRDPDPITDALREKIAAEYDSRSELPAKPTKPPRAKPTGDYAEAVDTWFLCHRAKYGVNPPWGDLQGRQMKAALKKCLPGEAPSLIRQFFGGPYPDSIKDGWPLSDGYACFVKRIAMLRADMTNPDRRAKAAEAKHLEQQFDFGAQLEAQGERVARKLQEERNGELGRLESTGPERGAIAAGDRDAVRGAQPTLVGLGVSALGEAPPPLLEGVGVVARPRGGLR